jgi:ABC-type taurine transport system substrate-binding protein
MKNIEEFIDRIVAEKDFKTKNPEVLEQIKKDLMDRFEDGFYAMVLNNLAEDKLEEFNLLLNEKNEEQISDFIMKNVPDIEQKLAIEMLEFKSIYLG